MSGLSKRKRVIFAIILLAITYLSLESISFAIYVAIKRVPFSFSVYQSTRQHLLTHDLFKQPMPDSGEITMRDEMIWGNVYEVVHPYVGYVHDPYKMKEHSIYGFPAPYLPIPSRTNNTFVIGIFGGSFAEQTAKFGGEALIHTLQQSPVFVDKQLIITPLALGGYKQPQQFMTLAFFLSLGERFDLIINIDGLNEVALGPAENVPKNVFPIYPRNWFLRMQNVQDTKLAVMVGKLALLYEKQKSYARIFSLIPLRYSVFANLIWGYTNKHIHHRIMRQEAEIQRLTVASSNQEEYVVTGPPFEYRTELDMYQALSQVWYNSSLQMYQLCSVNNIPYYHILQPNQYMPNSKPMGSEEAKISFLKDHPYKKPVEHGYPLLKKYGERLREHGVNFVDFTMIFATTEAIMYSDNIGHLTEQGYAIIGEALGKVILDHLSYSPPSS